jgi:uncharacterized membrane protein
MHMADQQTFADAEAGSADPVVRKIGLADLQDAIKRGIADFSAIPTHLIFVAIIYPVIGLFLARLTFGYDILPLLFPLVAGFTLMGPFAAIGLYEISRRREAGHEVTWEDAFGVLKSPSLAAIGVLGLILFGIFLAWLLVATLIYQSLFGAEWPDSIGGFLAEVFTTANGWMLIIIGNSAGFLFAALVLTICVVSFPLLLDRNVGAMTAIRTSVRAVILNPVVMAVWGLIVAGSLFVGALPFFIGLAVVVPVLAHTTWHLFRKVVER